MSRVLAGLGAVVMLATSPAPGAAQVTPGRVVWHDLVTRDIEVSKAFYGALLGWTWRAPTFGKDLVYVVGEKAGVAMAGISAAHQGKVNASQWITFFAVDNVRRATKLATDSGATAVVAPMRTGSWNDEAALLTDPQGAPFALMKPGQEPRNLPVPINGWLWVELWTKDLDAATSFYGNLLGWERQAVTVAGTEYLRFERDSTPMAGLLKVPVKDVRPNWLPTIRVADVNATVRQAVALGGRVILAPRPDVRNGMVAIIGDPTGAALAVQQWDGPLPPAEKDTAQ